VSGALVLHGFTSSPYSVRGVAEALAAAGCAVEVPTLPGHGTVIEDLLDVTFDDWVRAADEALARLPRPVVVVGQSMGATVALWLAARHPDIAGLALVNPLAEPPGELRSALDEVLAAGTEILPGSGSDIADPDAADSGYDGTPLRPLRTALDALDALQAELPSIACPVLLLTSTQDHVVPPSNSDHLAAAVAGPVERVALERSYHVATLDHDRALVEERIAEFVAEVTA
jgi:carboxylesterase